MEELFWADKLAQTIINRKEYHYQDKKMALFKQFVVKTSASISGVLHIGRLSDTIRGSTVHMALQNAGVKTELIWVAEDMDPLRKIPEGVPKAYEKYLGMPVTSIPDPEGIFESYAAKHKDAYLTVIDQFIFSKMKKFSMMEEYEKGHFKPFIKDIMANLKEIKDIQNKYRREPLPDDFSPWKPICARCGKIATPAITHFDGEKVQYECKDYRFEKTTAKGCGHKGDADPLKDKGKLLWKGEWAAQWARWKVCSEGAGKEYQVPNSAWWVNGEIVEKILDFPMPEPIFYEHLLIEGQKMSASVGNVVYPKDWLNVATAEMLRLLYNKRLMTTRSFSWKELPLVYEDIDRTTRFALGEQKLDNEKELAHYKKLHAYSVGDTKASLPMNFNHALMLVQFYENEDDMIASLKKTGQYDKKRKEDILDRLSKAKRWLKDYAPDEARFELQNSVKGAKISAEQRHALKMLAEDLKEKEWEEKDLFNRFYEICGEAGIKNTIFFQGAYQVLLKRDRGPKLASFILVLGPKKVADLFSQL
ncbi:MAG: lysine--tRNA ligase [Nanoarchaeota archaeon]